jgi:MFS family permease
VSDPRWWQKYEESRVLTAIPAICRFSEPIAFNSILAYTYAMVKDLHDGDETDASFYAGLLVSAYAVAEAMTAMGWGALSDKYGRKPIVLIGLGGVAISSLVFGLAKSYWVALLARFIGGALNGNVAVMQTMVAEMVKKPEHERKFCHQALKKIGGVQSTNNFSQPRRMQYSHSSGPLVASLDLLWVDSSHNQLVSTLAFSLPAASGRSIHTFFPTWSPS